MKKKRGEDVPDSDVMDFDIDPEDVKGAYIRIPSYLATLNAVYAKAVGRSIRAKFNRDRTYAEINAEIVEGMDKKPAEAQIKNMILMNPEYEKAVQMYAQAEEEKASAWGRCEAMIAKKEMVQSLGAFVREELGGGMGRDTDEEPRSKFAPDTDEDDD